MSGDDEDLDKLAKKMAEADLEKEKEQEIKEGYRNAEGNKREKLKGELGKQMAKVDQKKEEERKLRERYEEGQEE